MRKAFGEVTTALKQGYQPSRHRNFQMKGGRGQSITKILKEFIERGLIKPCWSEPASPCFDVPNKVAGHGLP